MKHFQFVSHLTLAQEILSVVVIKILFLAGLWLLFFSHSPRVSQMTALTKNHLFTAVPLPSTGAAYVSRS